MNNNTNHLDGEHQIETHHLLFPWKISDRDFNKFKNINNHFTTTYINSHTIEVPEETSIDLAPLLPPLLHLENHSIKIEKPLPELVKYNSNLRIETLDKTVINIKSMADLPTRQNGELYGQVRDWTKANGLSLPNDSSSLFEITINNIDRKYGPDVAYFPQDLHNDMSLVDRKEHTTHFAPSFVIENRSYSHGENNTREYQVAKMINWIRGGVQSGILVDGVDGMIDLYCSTGPQMLQQIGPLIPGQPPQFVHAHVAAQIAASNAIVQPAALPANFNQLPIQQQQLQFNQYIFNSTTVGYGHIYFQNMTVVPGHPNVCTVSIPFWAPQPQNQPQFGPNTIVHCIGEVNGFKLNMSTYPLQ